MDRVALHLRSAAARLRRRALVTGAGVALAVALAARGGAAELAGGWASLLYVVAVLAAIVHAAGSVADDFRSGAAALWLQKPGAPWAHYGGRFLEVALTSLTWVGGTLLVLALCSDALQGTLGAHALTAAWACLAATAVAFGVSALGARPEALVSVGVVYVLGALGADAAVDPGIFGAWSPVLAAQRFPVLELQAVFAWRAGTGSVPGVAAWTRTLLHPLSWILLGLAAVEWRSRRLTGAGGAR